MARELLICSGMRLLKKLVGYSIAFIVLLVVWNYLDYHFDVSSYPFGAQLGSTSISFRATQPNNLRKPTTSNPSKNDSSSNEWESNAPSGIAPPPPITIQGDGLFEPDNFSEAELEEQRFFQYVLEQDPQDIPTREEYIHFLYFHKHLDSAESQAQELLEIDKINRVAQWAIETTNDIRKQSTDEEKLSHWVHNSTVSDPEMVLNQVDAPVDEEWKREKELFDEKYAVTSTQESQYQPTFNELVHSLTAIRYARKGYLEKSEQAFETLFERYPNSPSVKSKYLQLLIMSQREVEALQLIEDLKNLYPNEPAFKVYGYWYPQITAQQSVESKVKLTMELESEIFTLESVRFDLMPMKGEEPDVPILLLDTPL